MNYLRTLLLLLLVCLPVSAQPPTIISGVINTYTKVTAVDYCSKTIGVGSSAGFAIGDRALIIQMQGAVIDTSNTPSFGTITAIGEAGNFEFVTIEAVSPTSLRLKYMLVQNYNPLGAVQLVRVPKYVTAWVQGAPLTAPAWDGTTGGVLAFEATAAVDIIGSIDVSGKGFRGGVTNSGTITEYHLEDFYTKLSESNGGGKGEGVAITDPLRNASRGACASGGGGGNAHNAGGGGGSNFGAGGTGGNEYLQGSSSINGGIGGKELRYSGSYPKVFMGGGGGSGHQNNAVGTPGAAGGGIVIIRSGVLVGRGNSILANGADQNTSARNDGAGGGGGGGSVYVDVERITSPVTIEVRGGKGGSVNLEPHGPGAGGGGGVIGVQIPSTLDSIIANFTGGAPGVLLNTTNNWGAEAGKPGTTVTGMIFPEGSVNPVVAQSSKDTTICLGGVAVIGRSPVGGRLPYRFSWSPAQGLDNASAEFPRATPAVSTFYTVSVTDSTGCVSQAQMWVNVYPKQVISAGIDTGVCLGSSVQLQATGKGRFAWAPSTGLNDSTSPNPTASPLVTTTYTLTVTDSTGCTSQDSVEVKVYDLPTITIGKNDSVCEGNALFLYNIAAENGTPPYSYTWSPGIGVSDIHSPAPVFSPAKTTRYKLSVMDAHGCMAADSFTIKVNPLPIADAGISPTICLGDSTRLNATTSAKVTWSPAEGLSATTIGNPFAFPKQSTTYYLTLENEFGCTATDSVRVTVRPLPPLPTLTLSTDTIFSASAVPVREYRWFLDGKLLLGATTATLIAAESGDYTLSIVDSNGCVSTSAPLNVILGKAILSVDDVCAYAGEIVEIPIRFINAERIASSRTAQFDLTLSFNASLLAPIDAGLLENTVTNGVRSIRMIVPFLQDSFPILTTLRFYAGLGNDTVTDVRLTKYSSIGGRVFLSDSGGRFCLKGVCTDGSVRLYRSGELSAITSIIPQPAGDKVTIDFISGESGTSTLSLVNVLGQTVATLVQGNQSAGIQRVEAELVNYNAGVYFLVLQTPTERVVRMLEIHK